MSTPNGTPDLGELLQRNAQLDKPPDPMAASTYGGQQQAPQFPNPMLPLIQQHQMQQPGGIKRFFTGMLQGMGDAAMKQSTGMTYAERQQMMEHAAQLHQQAELAKQAVQYAPLEHEAKLRAMTAQPRFDPQSGQWLGIMTDAQYQQYIKGQGAARIGAESRENVAATKATAQQGLAKQYASQMASGDQSGANETLKQINALTTATSKPSAPNEMSLRVKAQQGDPDSISIVNKLNNDRMALAKTRSETRLYQIQKFYDKEDEQIHFGTGFDVLRLQQQGHSIVPSGALNANEIKSFQQLTSEAVPAIAGVRKNIGTFDNAGDRAIFARVLKSAGSPRYGEEAGWMGNIINQSLKSGLSPEGQGAAISLLRLAETMGRLRSTLGGPSTDTQMGLALQLLPGASTPNSKYAGEQLNQLEQMVKQAVNIPVFGNKKQGGMAPQGGAKKDPLGIF